MINQLPPIILKALKPINPKTKKTKNQKKQCLRQNGVTIGFWMLAAFCVKHCFFFVLFGFLFFWFIVFFGFLVYCFFVFFVFPLNWDRLGSHKIAQKIAQNLNFGEDFARNHCKTQCFCILFCMKNISQEHPFCKFIIREDCF